MQFSFPVALTIAFVVLKLCHVIAWPWLWVAAPIWISGLIFLAIVLVLFAVAGIGRVFTTRAQAKRVAANRARALSRRAF